MRKIAEKSGRIQLYFRNACLKNENAFKRLGQRDQGAYEIMISGKEVPGRL